VPGGDDNSRPRRQGKIEPTIFWSTGGCDDPCATPPRHAAAPMQNLSFFAQTEDDTASNEQPGRQTFTLKKCFFKRLN
jgi:hypothetical protein